MGLLCDSLFDAVLERVDTVGSDDNNEYQLRYLFGLVERISTAFHYKKTMVSREIRQINC